MPPVEGIWGNQQIGPGAPKGSIGSPVASPETSGRTAVFLSFATIWGSKGFSAECNKSPPADALADLWLAGGTRSQLLLSFPDPQTALCILDTLDGWCHLGHLSDKPAVPGGGPSSPTQSIENAAAHRAGDRSHFTYTRDPSDPKDPPSYCVSPFITGGQSAASIASNCVFCHFGSNFGTCEFGELVSGENQGGSHQAIPAACP